VRKAIARGPATSSLTRANAFLSFAPPMISCSQWLNGNQIHRTINELLGQRNSSNVATKFWFGISRQKKATESSTHAKIGLSFTAKARGWRGMICDFSIDSILSAVQQNGGGGVAKMKTRATRVKEEMWGLRAQLLSARLKN
jgi:hypothetical protein